LKELFLVRYELEHLHTFWEKEALANKIEPPVQLKSGIFAAIDEINSFSNPNSIPPVMKGLSLSPQSLITVYWNRNSKEIYLSIHLLLQPPLGKQYQLWELFELFNN
jgi:hypothetical protein